MDIFKENTSWKFVKSLKNKLAVDEFLKEKNVKLPNHLLECVRNNNGGRPSIYLFDTNKREEYVFQSLFSYNHGDKCNIYDIYANFKTTTCYPIGLEASGNIICYDTDSKKLILWNHENGDIEVIK